MRNISIAFFLLLFNLSVDCQTNKKILGDSVYFDKFWTRAEALSLADLRLTTDTYNLRIWYSGKIIDVSVKRDSINLCKILFYIKYLSKEKDSKKSEIVHLSSSFGMGEYMKIKKQLDTLRNIPYDKIQFNSRVIFRQDGGVASGLEIADKNTYYLVTESYWDLGITDTVKDMVEKLNMNEEQTNYLRELPNGFWYNWGYTTNLYKPKFFGRIMLGIRGVIIKLI